ncbi:hypothetical protein QEN19_000197 [Hanseniaspora menglaensis]
MPSKNSVNRPKQLANNAKKQRKAHQKTIFRNEYGLNSKNSAVRGARARSDYSTQLEIYKNEYKSLEVHHGRLTNLLSSKSLSKKRSQKIDRNLKYVQKRQLLKEHMKQEKDNGNPNANIYSTDISVLPSSKVKDESLKPIEVVKSYINEVIANGKQQSLSTGFIGTNGTSLGKATF